MSERASLPISLAALLGGCLALGACAHNDGGGGRLSLADMPELGEPYGAQAATYRNVGRRLSINTPVGQLCDNPHAKAILDTDLPGLTTRPEYAFFKHMSLKKLQAMSGGKMTHEDLAKVDADLQQISLARVDGDS